MNKESVARISVEEVFDLLAEAASVRHPNPERENRGLCPAHSDTHNPGLVFRIADSGKLITYCFAQGCTPEDVADSIGVPLAAFFPGSHSPFAVTRPPTYDEPSLLELLKLLPLGMSHSEREDAVFRCLDIAYTYGVIDNDTVDIDLPIRALTNNTIETYAHAWVSDALDEDTDWFEIRDAMTTQMRQLNRSHRTHVLSSDSAIPIRRTGG